MLSFIVVHLSFIYAKIIILINKILVKQKFKLFSNAVFVVVFLLAAVPFRPDAKSVLIVVVPLVS